MDVWIWATITVTVGVVLADVWWRRHGRHSYVIDHLRVEMHPACVVEDRVVEVLWRRAISMTNTSRCPRMLPVLAERATVKARRREYLATVYLDSEASEVNPGEVALAWVEFVVPATSAVQRIELIQLSQMGSARRLRWTTRPAR